MGVSGCGKSTLGRALAEQWGRPFLDADNFHPAANVAKMRRGEPLTDDDRGPWLDRLNGLLRDEPAAVLACSALRNSYRRRLGRSLPGLRYIFMEVDRPTLARRMRQRQHFMPPALLDSQLATLEPPGPDEAMIIDGARPIDQLLAAIDSRR
jgi:gluconokinase